MATFVPRIRFMRVDLPTLGGPMMAIKADMKLISFRSLPFQGEQNYLSPP